MHAFARLLDRLSFEQSEAAKQKILLHYLQETPDPSRGWAVAALAGRLTFARAKPARLKQMILARCDQTLFELSYDFVGDLSETVSLLWPRVDGHGPVNVTLERLIAQLNAIDAQGLPEVLGYWLDRFEALERWALLKLLAGTAGSDISPASLKEALAAFGSVERIQIEDIWQTLEPPFSTLFAALERQADLPTSGLTGFQPMQPAVSLPDDFFDRYKAEDFRAVAQGSGCHVQLIAGSDAQGRPSARLFSPQGEDFTHRLQEVAGALCNQANRFIIEADLSLRDASGWLSRSEIEKTLQATKSRPNLVAYLRADTLVQLDGEYLIGQAFELRREKLRQVIEQAQIPQLSLSPMFAFDDWASLQAQHALLRTRSDLHGPMNGMILSHAENETHFHWACAPAELIALLMYAHRAHNGAFTEFTFGVWAGDTIVPIGRTSKMTQKLAQPLVQYVRRHSGQCFGPVQEVVYGPRHGLALRIGYQDISPAPRRKAGITLHKATILAIETEKTPLEIDRLEDIAARL